MSSLNEMGLPGNGLGILHPNLRHKFVVQFLDKDDNQLEFSHVLSQQVVAVEGLQEGRNSSSGATAIVFEDDIHNKAFRGLLELQKRDDLVIAIHQTDGAGQVLRSTYLDQVKVSTFSHSDLDYALQTSQSAMQLDVRFPNHLGAAIDQMKNDPTAAAILTALSGAQVQMTGAPYFNVSAASRLVAYVEYEDTRFTFASFPPISG